MVPLPLGLKVSRAENTTPPAVAALAGTLIAWHNVWCSPSCSSHACQHAMGMECGPSVFYCMVCQAGALAKPRRLSPCVHTLLQWPRVSTRCLLHVRAHGATCAPDTYSARSWRALTVDNNALLVAVCVVRACDRYVVSQYTYVRGGSSGGGSSSAIGDEHGAVNAHGKGKKKHKGRHR